MGNRNKFSVDISTKNGGVSGNCTLISVHSPFYNVNFLVDCGLYQGEEDSEKKNRDPFEFNPEKLQFVLLTHNHMDHVGRIPLLYKKYYSGKIYTTEDTKKMMPLALISSEDIIRKYAKDYSKKAIYKYSDVERAISNTQACAFNETVEPYPGIRATFFKNGHLIGAGIILVQISCYGYEDINLLFVGDYKGNNIFFDVPELPEWVLNLPIHVIGESTYGDVDSSEISPKCCMKNVSQWLKDGIKKVVIFAHSQGRYQEVNYDLKLAQGKIIDPSIQIINDGNLGIKFTNLYKHASLNIKPEMQDFLPVNHTFIDSNQREYNMYSNAPKIIVTTSGMASYGPAFEYISNLIDRKDVGFHFTSHLSTNSLGYKLMNSFKKTCKIGGVVKPKEATILATSEYTSHARRDELLKFYSQFTNLRSLLINHGEPDVKNEFAQYCEERLNSSTSVAILGNGYTIRVNSSEEEIKFIKEKEI